MMGSSGSFSEGRRGGVGDGLGWAGEWVVGWGKNDGVGWERVQEIGSAFEGVVWVRPKGRLGHVCSTSSGSRKKGPDEFRSMQQAAIYWRRMHTKWPRGAVSYPAR